MNCKRGQSGHCVPRHCGCKRSMCIKLLSSIIMLHYYPTIRISMIYPMREVTIYGMSFPSFSRSGNEGNSGYRKRNANHADGGAYTLNSSSEKRVRGCATRHARARHARSMHAVLRGTSIPLLAGHCRALALRSCSAAFRSAPLDTRRGQRAQSRNRQPRWISGRIPSLPSSVTARTKHSRTRTPHWRCGRPSCRRAAGKERAAQRRGRASRRPQRIGGGLAGRNARDQRSCAAAKRATKCAWSRLDLRQRRAQRLRLPPLSKA